MGSLLLFSLGPIQEFIASARRCQDLWFGSHLLGDLAWAAARVAQQTVGADAIIFPGVAETDFDGSSKSIANKLLVRVEEATALPALAKEMEKAIHERLLEHWAGVERVIDRTKGAMELLHREAARAQIEDLIETAWVGVDASEGYEAARNRSERLLAARKNTKMFAPPSWGAEVPKCALDGNRESVIDEAAFPKKATKESTRILYEGYRAHPRERLSAVGILKRHGAEDPSKSFGRPKFDSTSDVAMFPWLSGVLQIPGIEEEWRILRTVLEQQLGSDVNEQLAEAPGEIFFEGRLEEYAEEHEASKEELRAAKAAQLRFLSFVRRSNLRPAEPIPYYALLLADGDRMGRAIDAAGDFETHQRLSKALADFADGVAKTVEHYEGSCIYAGGDDVLALLPLHTVLECARDLESDFRGAMSPFAAGDQGPTLSVGVAVGHHIARMDETLDLARRAEALAKVQRNSLAVIVDKRSGPPVEVVGAWDAKAPLDERIDWMAGLHRRDALSDKAAFELSALERLVDDGKHARPRAEQLKSLEGVLKAELLRTLVRKQPQRGKQEKLETEVSDKLEQLGILDPAALGRELQVARLFADAANQSEGPRKAEDTGKEEDV